MQRAPLSVNRPRKQHEVEAVCPVPLSFVEGRPLLHQVLQISGIHLQPSDHVIHVALVVLVMNVAKGQRKERRRREGKGKKDKLPLQRTTSCTFSQSFYGLNMATHICHTFSESVKVKTAITWWFSPDSFLSSWSQVSFLDPHPNSFLSACTPWR